MKTSKIKLVAAGLLTMAVLASASKVSAAGAEEKEVITEKKVVTTEKKTVCTTQYGGGTECSEVEVPREEIVRVTEKAGIVEDMFMAGSLFGLGYVALLTLNKKTV